MSEDDSTDQPRATHNLRWILAAGAAVLVAAAVAVGVGQLHNDSDAGSSAGGTSQAPEPSGSSPDGDWTGRPRISAAELGATCPAHASDMVAQVSGTGPLVSSSVQSVVICVYPISPDGGVGAVALPPAEAEATITSLDSAATAASPATTACPMDFGPSVHFIVRTGDGPVTMDGQVYGCGYLVSGSNARLARTELTAVLTDVADRLRPVSG